jgi:hypothetical protein
MQWPKVQGQTDKQWSAKYHKEKLKIEQHEPQKNLM